MSFSDEVSDLQKSLPDLDVALLDAAVLPFDEAEEELPPEPQADTTSTVAQARAGIVRTRRTFTRVA